MKVRNITLFTLIALAVAISTTAEAQLRPYRVSDRQVEALLNRIESKTNDFKREIDRSLDKTNIDGTRREDSINTIVSNFENATDALKNNFSSRRSAANDVQEVLNRAVFINSFMRNNRMSRTSETLWSQIRTDLDTLAGYYRVTSTWNDKVSPPIYQGGYTATDTQMRNLLARLRRNSTSFQLSFNSWNNRYNRNNQTASSDVQQDITDLNRAIDDLSRNFNDRNGNSGNVEQVLRPSASINNYMMASRLNGNLTTKWNAVRSDLTTLASYYRLSWDWNNPSYTNNPYIGSTGGYNNFDSQLTGTYRLNMTQSDNVQAAVDRAISNSDANANQRDRSRRGLERRLTSPETLTLEKRGQQVTMSSDNSQSVSLNADGVKQTETSPNGRTVTTSITATNRDLTINYEGDRINDYYVSFMPMSNGQLKVTRRVYLENQNTTVTVSSVYDKTSPTPLWNTSAYPSNTPGGMSINAFLIPNNTPIVATLDSQISTKTTRDNNRFSMTVTSPSQYSGAVIEGTVNGEGSGVVSGRANLSLNFDTIRLRNGRTYNFAGIVDQVRQPNGDVVNVNNEGRVEDSSQTKTTVVRTGIGATLGAIIGAIAGGGKGAAIGAAVGGGAGAGTVVLQGRDNLELASGSTFSITSTAPSNVSMR